MDNFSTTLPILPAPQRETSGLPDQSKLPSRKRPRSPLPSFSSSLLRLPGPMDLSRSTYTSLPVLALPLPASPDAVLNLDFKKRRLMDIPNLIKYSMFAGQPQTSQDIFDISSAKDQREIIDVVPRLPGPGARRRLQF